MTTYPTTIHECVGPYLPCTLQGSFDSAASSGDLWTRDVDATVAVRTFEAPWPGFVSYLVVDAQGGNFTGTTFAIQIETVANAVTYTITGVAVGSKIFLPSQIQFNAGDSIAVEADVVGTFRDCAVTLGLLFNLGSN
jgi:hypothetical protein